MTLSDPRRPDSNRQPTHFTRLIENLAHSASRIFFRYKHAQDNIKDFIARLLLDNQDDQRMHEYCFAGDHKIEKADTDSSTYKNIITDLRLKDND